MPAERGDVVTGDYGGADDACDIRTHGVHEQEIRAICLLPDVMRHTGRHRHGRDTG